MKNMNLFINDMNNVSKRSMGTLYKRTINREQKIKELGYNLIIMWESDWNKINKSISILQKKFRTCKLIKKWINRIIMQIISEFFII